VSRREIAECGATGQLLELVEVDRFKQFEGFVSVSLGVERESGGVAARALAVVALGVFFLQATAIGQGNPAESDGATGGVDRAAISLLDQAGQVADVVGMRVREDDRVDLVGGDFQRVPVARS